MLRKFSFILLSLIIAVSSAWAIQNPVNMLNKTIVVTQDKLMANSKNVSTRPIQTFSFC